MSKLIGVTHVEAILGALKQAALSFDEIGIWNLETYLSGMHIPASLAAEFEWLADQGVIYVPSVSPQPVDNTYARLLEEAKQHLIDSNPNQLLDELNTAHQEYERSLVDAADNHAEIEFVYADRMLGILRRFGMVDEVLPERFDGNEAVALWKKLMSTRPYVTPADSPLAIMEDYISRLFALNLGGDPDIEPIPLLRKWIGHTPTNAVHSHVVLDVVIKNLPVPDEEVPWEKIIDFRDDPQTRHKYVALRHWIRGMTDNSLSPKEVGDELEWLIAEYEQHMHLHRLKFHRGILATCVTTIVETLEDTVKLRFGKIAKGLFSYQEREASLLEAELKAPGREIAYIVAARSRFGDSHRG